MNRTFVAVWIWIGLVLILCSLIVSRTMIRIRSGDEVIRVTGSAQQPITSDFIIWDGKVTEQAATMASAYSAVQSDGEKVRSYLLGKGVQPAEITVSSITTKTLYLKQKGDSSSDAGGDSGDQTSGAYQKVAGYALSQTFEVRSSDVARIAAVSRRATELISSGVPFESASPEYLYTKLSDLKVRMLSAAARDARARAEQIASSSGCRLGDVRFARMGVLQVEPLYNSGNNDNEISDTGANDTSSLDKKIIAVVTCGFAIK